MYSKVNAYRFAAGDRLVIEGVTSGGFGDPLDREPERVLSDCLDELISVEQARDIYGVVIEAGRSTTPRPTELRARMRAGASTRRRGTAGCRSPTSATSRCTTSSPGPEDKPLILQFGGSLFGRANFDSVNDGFRENFRLLSFDATGYGRSTQPLTSYTIEGWADEGAGLLDALGIERVLDPRHVDGRHDRASPSPPSTRSKTIASCADCGMVRCDAYRRHMFRNWRQQCEALPMDDFCDLLTIQAVGADFIEEQPRGLRQRQAHRQRQLALHGAPGVPGDGDDGPRAARRRTSAGRCC